MPNLATVKQRVAAADAAQGTGGLLTRKVDAAVQGLMRKKLNPNQKWQKVLVVDRSGSMGYSYPDEVQDAVNRDLAFAVIVDDDGKVPTCFFDHNIEELIVGLDDFHNLISRRGITARGSTDLAGALRWVAETTGNGDLFRSGMLGGSRQPEARKMDTPVFATIITDGAPDDKRRAVEAVQRLSYRAIVLKFIYVGDNMAGWRFLEQLDDDIPVGTSFDRGGRLFDNVDSKKFASLASADDAAFYDAMFDEVPAALAAMKQHGLL